MKLRMSLLTGAMALALSVPAAAQYTTPVPGQTADPVPGQTAETMPGQRTELAPGMTASVTAGVNLRAGPGSQHDRITVIPEGAAVMVEDCMQGWCQVAYDGFSGFVYDAYLATDVAADAYLAPDVAAVDDRTLHTTSPLELRAGPGFEHGMVGMIPAGAAVTVEQCMPGWCQVTYDGMTGYLELAETAPEEMTLALAGPAVGEGWAQATADINLRAGPGTEHAVLTVIPEGAEVQAIRQCMPGWCEVTYGDMTGYASEAYLDNWGAGTAAALAPPADAVAPPTAGVATDAAIAQATSDLNLRAGAGMEHSPIGVIPAGAAVEIHDCIPGRVWCEVSYGGMTGYASATYLN